METGFNGCGAGSAGGTPDGGETGRRWLLLRPMTREDLASVILIERASFVDPWSPEMFTIEFETAVSRRTVACRENRLIGYCVYWMLPEVVDIIRIAVDPQMRRQGAGRRLLVQAMHEAAKSGARRCTLEVRGDNGPARKFYGDLGFGIDYIRKKYYTDSDAVLMSAALGGQEG